MPCDYSENTRRRKNQTKDYRGLQDRLKRVEAMLEASPPRTLMSDKSADTTAHPMAACSQSLFQSFTLQMEKIEDAPAARKSPSATIPELQVSYTGPIRNSNEPPSQDLSFDNLTTFGVHLPTLPTLPPTPSSHHGDPGVRIATPCDDVPFTDPSIFSSPGEDDGSSTAPPEQEVSTISPCSSCISNVSHY